MTTVKNTTIPRPLALPAACAPVSAGHLPVVTDVPQLSWAHQVQVPVWREPAQASLVVDGGYGANGFLASQGIDAAMKRMTDGARGVPPRGRPV